MRVVFDANVFISALLSQIGAPARLLGLWSRGEFELVVCPALLKELEEILGRPRLRAQIDPGDAGRFLTLLVSEGMLVPDVEPVPSLRSSDPDDDYLLALAARERVPLVSGDKHLLALRDRAPVFSPREFLDRLGR